MDGQPDIDVEKGRGEKRRREEKARQDKTRGHRRRNNSEETSDIGRHAGSLQRQWGYISRCRGGMESKRRDDA